MTDEEDAMMLAPMEWVAPEMVDQVDEEYEEELGRTRDLAISKEIADAIISTRKSEFHKTVMDAIASLAPDSRSEFLRYSMSIPQQMVLFFQIHSVPGSFKSIEYKEDRVYDLGDGNKFKTKDECDFDATIPALVKEFNGDACVIPTTKSTFIFMVRDAIVTLTPCDAQVVYDITNRGILNRIFPKIVWKKAVDPVKMVDYVVFSHDSFQTTSLKVKKQDCDVKMNYNDDLPDEKITSWINSPKSGLMVLHGEPGTGKTSYIRNLIYRTKKRFMFFDKSLFHHMSDSSLIDMLLDHRNSVIVLEDCEDLLTDRTGLGSCMTTILNLTDGIIGDSMKFKFICTFNADVMDIDPAILRKGRMHLKYEFKKLNADKVVALGKALGVDAPHEEMPLCDVYNFAVDNGKPQEKSKVGF